MGQDHDGRAPLGAGDGDNGGEPKEEASWATRDIEERLTKNKAAATSREVLDVGTMKLIEAALNYHARGVSIIPVGTDKRPLVQWSEFQKRRPTEEEIREWWSRWPDAGIGLVCGRVSAGVVVLDVDPRNGGTADGLPSTGMRSRTGGGGVHLFYRYRGDRPFPKQWRQGVDIKTDGGYVILPPSLHASGNAYQWVEEGQMGELPDPPLRAQRSNSRNTPGWVADLLACEAPQLMSG